MKWRIVGVEEKGREEGRNEESEGFRNGGVEEGRDGRRGG